MAVTAWGGKTLATTQTGNKRSTTQCQTNVFNWITSVMRNVPQYALFTDITDALNVRVKMQEKRKIDDACTSISVQFQHRSHNPITTTW